MDKLYTHTIVFADDMGELLLYSNNFNTAEEYLKFCVEQNIVPIKYEQLIRTMNEE
jgi:hypothetical protein